MVRRDSDALGDWPRRKILPLAGLLLGLVAGCGGSLNEEQLAAVAKMQQLGGRVSFSRGGYEIDMSTTAIQDADLVQLQRIPNLRTLDLQNTRVTDAGLAHLKPIETLEMVILVRTMVTREAAQDLQKSLPKAQIRR